MNTSRVLWMSLTALGSITTAACVHGPFQWHAARGVWVNVRSNGGEALAGELLAVTDSGMVVLNNQVNRVAFARYRGVNRISISSDGGATRNFATAALDAADLERLRYYSRFPAGLDGERLDGFLSLFNQQSLDGFPTRVSADTLREAARSVADRFPHPEDAIAAGYRPIGPDFPEMGQHWVNIRTLMSGRVDAAEPAVITYTSIEGRATLVNVAHAVVMEADEGAPDVFDVPPESWHGHAGTVADAILAGHGHLDAERGAGPGVSMLHVWLVPNPDGALAQHNWLLPFQRLGVETPTMPVKPGVAQGLALATTSGEEFQLQAVRGLLTGEHRREAEEVVRRRAMEARALLDGLHPGATMEPERLAALEGLWATTGRELESLAPDESTRRRIVELYELELDVHGADAHRPSGAPE